MIVVAQRVSTIMHADQIIVLDDGRIVGRSTHAELLADCETYREIVESQLTAEEAASNDRAPPAAPPQGMFGPGSGLGMGLPPEKARDFRGTLRRMGARLRPERLVIALVLVLGWSACSSP